METEVSSLCSKLGEPSKAIPNVRDSDMVENVIAPDDSPILEGDTDNSWEHRLNTFKQKIEELQESYDQSYLEIGRVLIQAREVYKGHGDWIKWLKENVSFSVRHAQRLIRVAEMLDSDDATLVSQLGLTSSKAYILTRVSKNDIGHFLHTFFPVGDKKKPVKNMTRRELELVVTEFLKGKVASRDHEDATFNQGVENLKDHVESNLEELKKILNKTIVSIKKSDSGTRDLWISELEVLYKTGLDQLTAVSE